MALLLLSAVVALAVSGALARLWWVLRQRARRRRERAWQRWWTGYRRRLAWMLVERWSRGRAIEYRPDESR